MSVPYTWTASQSIPRSVAPTVMGTSSEVSALATLVLSHKPISARDCIAPKSIMVVRRSVWWDCHRSRVAYSELNGQRRAKERCTPFKRKHAETWQGEFGRGREPGYQVWQWRLSTSWGANGNSRKGNENKSSPEQGGEEASSAARTRPMDKTVRDYKDETKELKRQLAEDPFGVIFGPRIVSGGSVRSFWPSSVIKHFSRISSSIVGSHPDMRSDNECVADTSQSQTTPASRRNSGLQCVQDGSFQQSRASRNQVDQVKSSDADKFHIDPITLRKVSTEDHPPSTEPSEDKTNIPVKIYRNPRHQSSGRVPESRIRSTTAEVLENPNRTEQPSSHTGYILPISSIANEGISSKQKSSSARSSQSSTEELSQTIRLHEPEASEHDRRSATSWLLSEGFSTASKNSKVDDRSIKSQRGVGNPPQPQVDINNAGSSSPRSIRPARTPEEDEDLDRLRPADVRASAGVMRTSKGKSREVGPQSTGVQSHSLDASTTPKELSASKKTIGGTAPSSIKTGLPASVMASGNGMKGNKLGDKELIEEIRGIYETKYGAINTTHRQINATSTSSLPIVPTMDKPSEKDNGPCLKPSDSGTIQTPYTPINPKNPLGKGINVGAARNGTIKSTVENCLSEYEAKLGPNLYQFQVEQQPSEAGPTGQTNSTDFAKNLKFALEAQTLRWEEQEQILHEEIMEGEHVLHDIQNQLEAIIRARTSRNKSDAQLVVDLESTKPPPASIATYKILAYDPSTQQVSIAETTSTWAVGGSEVGLEQPLSPAKVIPQLHSPAKFLSHLRVLDVEGFEIVAGGGDVLIFKKVRDAVVPPAEALAAIVERTSYDGRLQHSFVNPIDGTTTGNFASPTGFVNHEVLFAQDMAEEEGDVSPSAKAPTDTKSTVKRQEEVSSDQGKQETIPQATGTKSKARRTVRRMLWVGLWVAGCTYAVGVVADFFRTGGSSGTGIHGL